MVAAEHSRITNTPEKKREADRACQQNSRQKPQTNAVSLFWEPGQRENTLKKKKRGHKSTGEFRWQWRPPL